jgi:hypothetical protein
MKRYVGLEAQLTSLSENAIAGVFASLSHWILLFAKNTSEAKGEAISV